jgi:hypothetical protein
VLGDGPGDAAGAVEAVRGLVDQSLLNVRESPAGVRYRMLETVREFGRLRLADAGEERTARDALRQWAAGYARRHSARVVGPGQFDAIDALGAEETNLADELREAIADDDRRSLVRLLAALGLFWTLRGDHARLVVLAEAVADAVRDWEPPPDLAEDARAAVAVTLANSLMTGSLGSKPLSGVLRRLSDGPAPSGDDGPHVTGLVRVLLAYDPHDADASRRRLERLADDTDRHTASAASQWLSHLCENAGDPEGAIKAAERTLDLIRDEDGPWSAAMPHVLLADLTMNVGDDRATAVRHAQAALPVMERLGAADDVIQLRSALVLSAIATGRLADAADELARLEGAGQVTTTGDLGTFVLRVARAELMLARGDVAEGLRLHRESAVRMRELRIPGVAPSQMQPWTLAGDAMALSAHAHFATGADEVHGRELFRVCREHAARVLGGPAAYFDIPAAGLLLFALGAWGLLRGTAPAADASSGGQDAALRLLALADRFRYSRGVPSMAWELIVGGAEQAAPGRLARLQSEYENHEPAGLLAEADRLARQLPG